MTDVRAATEEFLEDKPDAAEELEELLAVDAANETWAFDDVSIDSGAFGELVSRDIIEKDDDVYQLRDRAAVERALGEDVENETNTSDSQAEERLSMSLPAVDRVAAAGLGGALTLVVLFRTLPVFSVFRNGDVVLSGNDPYAYRYFVHQLLAEGGVLDLSVLTSLPGRVAHGEPLFVATLWWVSALFGGSGAADYVLAVYPVASGVLTAVLVYLLTVRVTDDKRVGIAAVALLAVIPAHAFRTGLGFADHHAFDYPWLVLTTLALVSLIGRDLRDKRTVGWMLLVGLGIGAQTLAWDAGALLLAPLALYVALVVPSWLRDGRSPAIEAVPLLGGMAVGAVIVMATHYVLGWHFLEVAAAPVLLLAGAGAVVTLGEVTRRAGLPPLTTLALEAIGGGVGFALLWVVYPEFITKLSDGVDFLVTTGGIAETVSLVSGQLGSIAAPVVLFGFALFLAVPYLAWAGWRSYREHSPQWLAVSCYGWSFLVLALVQVRFAGQLALFAAVFGGLGLVHLAAWIDLTDDPLPFASSSSPRKRTAEASQERDLAWPERRDALHMAGLGLGAGGLGALLTPAKQSQLSISESTYRAARFMRAYAAERGWDYPDNYVFSQWSRNRVYNWFVNGESRGYAYALANYEDFVASSDPTAWYQRLRNNAGFVVLDENAPTGESDATIYEQLWADDYGLGTGNYRLLWTDEDDSRRVYTTVTGARVTGPVDETDSLAVEGESKLAEQTVSLSREMATAHGVYQFRIPLPGSYEIGETQITIDESAVVEGTTYSNFSGPGVSQWAFDEGDGEWAYDRSGGYHAQLEGASWVEATDQPALAFSGDGDYLRAPPLDTETSQFTAAGWISPETSSGGTIISTGKDGGGNSHVGFLFDHGLSGWLSDRLGAYVGDGDASANAQSPRLGLSYPTDEYHHVAMVFDAGAIDWYLDGEHVGSSEVGVERVSHDGERETVIGREFSSYGGVNYFTGSMRGLSYYERALSPAEVSDLADR